MSLKANPAATDTMPKIARTSATRAEANADVRANRSPTMMKATRNRVRTPGVAGSASAVEEASEDRCYQPGADHQRGDNCCCDPMRTVSSPAPTASPPSSGTSFADRLEGDRNAEQDVSGP